MICIQQNLTTGALEVMNPQPVDASTCVMVLSSGSDAVNVPWSLSVEDASLVSASIIGVWGLAWAFKALILTLKGNSQNEENV